MDKGNKQVKVGMRITEAEAFFLDSLARASRMTRSELLRHLIANVIVTVGSRKDLAAG